MNKANLGAMVILALLALTVAACESNRCSSKHDLIGFTIVESINIPLNGRQYKHITPGLYETDTLTLLVGLDSDNPGIDFYNLNEKKFLKRIELDDEGPDGIIDPSALVIHNLDSMFLMNDNNQLYLFNHNGEKRARWNFNLKLPDSILEIDKSMTGEFIVAAYGKSEYLNLPFDYSKKDNSIFSRLLPLNTLQGSDEYTVLYRSPNMVQCDLASGKIIKLFGKYPEEFLKDPKPHNPFAHFVRFKNNTWIQFDSSNDVYWVERDSFICLPSKYSAGNFTRFKNGQEFDEEKEMRSYHTDEAYAGIYYDPYNDLIYRVFQHFQPDKDSEGKLNQKLQSAFSILLIDLNGKILGEAHFDGGTYNFLDMLVTKRGLLISKENSFNEENIEELYSFDLVTFTL